MNRTRGKKFSNRVQLEYRYFGGAIQGKKKNELTDEVFHRFEVDRASNFQPNIHFSP